MSTQKSLRTTVADDWRIDINELDDCEIIFHDYAYGDYCGSAFTLFMKNGILYECNGGHCSCYGLEGQWDPEETSVEALKKRDWKWAFSESYEWDTVAVQEFMSLLRNGLSEKVMNEKGNDDESTESD